MALGDSTVFERASEGVDKVRGSTSELDPIDN